MTNKTELSDQTQFALIGKDISQIQKDLGTVSVDLKEIKNGKFITEEVLLAREVALKKEIADDFKPVKTLVYGLITMILVAVIGAVLKLVLIP